MRKGSISKMIPFPQFEKRAVVFLAWNFVVYWCQGLSFF